MNIKLNSRFKVNENVIWRYESKINGGTLFLYNGDNGKIYEGNHSLYLLIKNIEEDSTCKAFLMNVSKDKSENYKQRLYNNAENMINFLMNNGIVTYKE